MDSNALPRHNPLSVLMVASSFPSSLGDWKSVFIRHLAEALSSREDIALRLWAPIGEASSRIRWATTPSDSALLSRLMAQGGLAHLLRNHPLKGFLSSLRVLVALRAAAQRTDADIYHVNWLQNALSLPKDEKPIVVSVLGTDMQLLRVPFMRHLLRRTFIGRRVVICPNAEWMLPILHDAFGDLANITFVPLGIDPGWFQISRSPLPQPARWLAVTRVTKGKLGSLLEWCAPYFADGRRELHLFGPMQEIIAMPSWVFYHGPSTPDELRDLWFPTATGLITLSRHAEGRPQVMLEAMAAGVPVLASDIPAHANFLRHGETGLLCRSATDLGAQLEYLEDPTENVRIGHAAQDWAKRQVGTWDDCAGRYLGAYVDLLGADA